MTHRTLDISDNQPPKPATTIQTLTLNKPKDFGTPDLESLAVFLCKSFAKYNLKIEFNIETEQIELTGQRTDGKPISRGAFYQVRRAYLGFIRGWVAFQTNH